MNPFAPLLEPPKPPTGAGRVHRIEVVEDLEPFPPRPTPQPVVTAPKPARPPEEPKPLKVDKVTRRRTRLLEYLRLHGRANAADLCALEKVCARTIYRDMIDLQALGHPIEGLVGNGYVWRGERA